MDNYEDRIINGFYFKSKAEYARAQKELDTINQIKEKMDTFDINAIEQMYIKMVSKTYFSTPVGLSFLYDMRKYIEDTTGNRELPYIPVPMPKKVKVKGDNEQIKKLEAENENIKFSKKILTVIIITLAVVVIGMFFIAATSDNTGFIKKEEKIIDKYSSWQETLEQKEEELIKWEEELNNREKEINGKENKQ